MQPPCESGEAAVQPSTPSEPTFCPRDQRRFVLMSAILASALGFIDGSIVAIAIPAIRSDLGATLADAQWISNAYALTLSALILAGGAAGDRFGLRRTFITGISLFVLASLLCAAAPGSGFLIGARALQGIGAAIMVPCSLAIIAKAYPRQERGRAIGIWASASALTTALGPILGGFVLSSFDPGVWRAIFAINLPLGGLAVYLLATRVPEDAASANVELDLGGAALATLALGFVAYGLTATTADDGGLPAAGIATAIALGIGLFVLFLAWEARQAEPMVDLNLFRLRAFSGANGATFALYFAMSAILFYLPMLLIAGWGLGETKVGLIFAPLSAFIALLSGPVGAFADRVGPRLPITAGCLVVSASFCGLAVVTGQGIQDFWAGIFPFMVLMGLGMALVVSPLSTAVMTSIEEKDTGSASGINNAVARVAGLFAVAAMGGVAAWRYGVVLGESAAAVPQFGEVPERALDAALEAARQTAGNAAFSAVAWTTAALCLLAALIAWGTVPGAGTSVTEQRTAEPSG